MTRAAATAAAPVVAEIAARVSTLSCAAMAVLPLALGSVILLPPVEKPTLVFTTENLANNGNMPSAGGGGNFVLTEDDDGKNSFNYASAIIQAAIGKRNLGIGSGTRAQCDKLAHDWLGSDARPMSNGKGLVSADGTRTYRYPSAKDSEYATTGVQSNFEKLVDGKVVSNAHLNILD